MGTPNQSTETTGKKGGKIGIVISSVIIVLLLVIIVILLVRPGTPVASEGEVKPKRDVVVNEDNAEDVAEQLLEQEQIRSGSYEVTMNSEWRFEDGSSASENAYVENVAHNTNDVYFDLHLAETDELIYSSPVIPRGSYLENFALDKDLEAGSYDCVLTYHLIDAEQRTLSTLKLSVIVIVEN